MVDRSQFISVIIPCRNEKNFISKCLDSVIGQDYPKDKLEVLVIDGMSEDGTREIVKDYFEKNSFIKILDNPKKFTPFGLNIGIRAARGEIIVRMDAHAGYEKDYISKCVKYLEEYNADNVGGVMETKAGEDSIVARAISFCMSNFFGTGGSPFRVGSKEIREVDTVFGGCYKRKVFDRIGLFNEKLQRSQDMEFNIRLKKAGGKIILAPDIISYYYPKSDLKEFFIHNINDGIWAILPLKFTKKPLKLRHYLPLMFVLTLPISIWPYLLLSIYFSARITVMEKDVRLLLLMPVVFISRHIGYGIGSIWGLIKLFIK